jgi:IS4 transposase
MYELYSLAEQIGEQFIIRSKFDRLDAEKNHVLQTLRDSLPVGKTVVTLPANRKTKTKERDVTLIVQYGIFDVARPSQYVSKELPESLRLTLVGLFEGAPLESVDPVEWVLMTNLDVAGVDDVLLVAEYYKQRWRIERFHFVLKSGCMVERIQQRSLEGIELVVLMYSIISVHVM